MVDIAALMRALPISALEPDRVASIGNFIETQRDQRWRDRIALLEPPAGQRVPYIDPIEALVILLRRQGLAPQDAKARASLAAARMRSDVADDHWVNFFNDIKPDSPECLPVPDFTSWLRKEQHRTTQFSTDLNRDEILIPPDIIDFFEKAAEVATKTPMFTGPGNRDEPWSLETLPAQPPPYALIEYVPAAPWANEDCYGELWNAPDNPFMQWREAMRPVAIELESALGEPVYHFADLDDDLDDDAMHRLIVLHWCCTCKPNSAYIRFLVKVAAAKDVDELKSALLNPTSYTQPFKMNSALIGLEAVHCDIDYLAPDEHRTVAVVFLTKLAREGAQSLLEQQIGAHAFIVAPKDLATNEWVKLATVYCRDWRALYMYDGQLNRPIDILAAVDELFVIANEDRPKSGFDLNLSEPVEDLLWLALDLGVEARYYFVDRFQLGNPESCLERRGAPARAAAQKAQRAEFTRQLKTIRLDNDFGSSGLWDTKGRNLGYDLLDLPFPLVRRIAAWQRDYNNTINPPVATDDAWWDRHWQEMIDIAKSLQAVLGSETVVTLFQGDEWMSIDQIERASG